MSFLENLPLVHCLSTAFTLFLTKLPCSHPPSMAERNYSATEKRLRHCSVTIFRSSFTIKCFK